jgi:hypothetical protein
MIVRICRLTAVVLLGLIFALPAPPASSAEPFSFFGARFGATRDEIAKIWTPVGDGAYSVPGAPLRQVTTLFDHQGHLVRITFSLDLPFSDPPEIIGKAIQQVVENRWAKDPDLGTTTMAGRFDNQISVWNKKMVADYTKHVEEQVSSLLKP